MTDRDTFQSWLTAYGAAWEKLDAEAYLPLFSEDAAYYWTPFEAPHRGHDAILAALVDAIARQGDPSFRRRLSPLRVTSGGRNGHAVLPARGPMIRCGSRVC